MLTMIYVTAADFTFSTTKGFKPVPFATAGDCYSSTKRCPQVNIQLQYMLLCRDFCL